MCRFESSGEYSLMSCEYRDISEIFVFLMGIHDCTLKRSAKTAHPRSYFDRGLGQCEDRDPIPIYSVP